MNTTLTKKFRHERRRFLVWMLALTCLCGLCPAEAQVVAFDWAVSMGGTNGSGDQTGRDIAVDASGNVYTTGNFNGTADFDPGPGMVNLTAVDESIFVSKLSSDGNFLWAKAIGGPEYGLAEAEGIGVDDAGNVYVTGQFEGPVDFDPGEGTVFLDNVANRDVFVSKLNSAGEFQWAMSLGGLDEDFGLGIAVDEAGNCYTTGLYRGTADFDPGPGTLNLTSASGGDAFVLKLDMAGNLVWARSVGRATGYGIAVGDTGDVYTTGSFAGTIDFDPGPGTLNLTSGSEEDIFILKLTANGNFSWAKVLGEGRGLSIAVDSLSNAYTTGYFDGTVDFNPGAGTTNLTSLGSSDIFVSALNSAGNFSWAKSMGSIGTERGFDIVVDSQRNVYTTGMFVDPVDFDPGAGTTTLTPLGMEDVFVSRLGSTGNFVWAGAMGGTGADVGFGIALDPSDNVHITGQFFRTVDFDPGEGTAELTVAGNVDIFVTKLTTEVVAPVPVPSSSGGGGGICFIATAAYGTPMADEVDVLRGVRDGYLLNGVLGTAFVDAYYRVSPPVADVVGRSAGLRGVVRVLLAPVVLFSRVLLGAPGLVVLVGLVLVGLLARVAVTRVRRVSLGVTANH